MKLGKRPGRAKSKKEKEGTRRGEKWGDGDNKSGAKKDDSRSDYKGKKKKKHKRGGKG